MKKNIIIYSSVALIIILVATGISLYYYYCIATVDSYVLLKYTPPKREESIFGWYTYRDPEFSFESLPSYGSDEEALEVQRREAINSKEYFLKKYQQEIEHPSGDNEMVQKAMLNALEALLNEQRILIRTTHTRSFNAEEALQAVKEHWADNKLQDYAESHKVEIAVYPLN